MILAACTVPTEFLGEDSHAAYLVELINASAEATRIKNHLYSRLMDSPEDQQQSHMSDVVSVLSSKGDRRAQQALRLVTERNIRRGSTEVRELLVGLGKRGLEILLKTLDSMPIEAFVPDKWNEFYWKTSTYVPRSKGDHYLELFRFASPSANRMLDERGKDHQQEKTFKVVTAAELLDAWNKGNVARGTVRYFVEHASEEEFENAAKNFPSVKTELDRYLRLLFRDRPYPLAPSTLFPLATGKDGRVTGAAFGVLKRIVSPEVRAFGITQLHNKGNGSLAVDLLVANYKSGDEEKIRRRAERSTTRLDLHQTLQTLLCLVEDRPDLDPMYLEHLYERVPCSTCRYGVVKLLIQRKRFDQIKLDECLYDADFATRKLAKKELRRKDRPLAP